MEPRPISIGKNPLIGLTKLVRGETVSAVNVHDCIDTMIRAMQNALKETDAHRDSSDGQAIVEELIQVRTLLSNLLSERMAMVWKSEQESRIPAKDYDNITLADIAPYDLPDLSARTVKWLEG